MKREAYFRAGILLFLAATLSSCLSSPLGGATQVSHSIRVRAGEKTAIGGYSTIKENCTSNEYPNDSVTKPSSHGKVDIEHSMVLGDYKKYNCGAKQVRGDKFFYTSDPGFVGVDTFTIRTSVTNGRDDGSVNDLNYTVTVVK